MSDAAKNGSGERGDVGSSSLAANASALETPSPLLDSLSPRVKRLLMAQPLNPLVRGSFEVLPSGVNVLRGAGLAAVWVALMIGATSCKHYPVPGVDQHEHRPGKAGDLSK